MTIPAASQPSFDEFYVGTWNVAARWAAALTGDAATGEEVAQTAFLAVAGRYRDLENPTAYLRQAIVNEARMTHRSDTRRTAREQRTTDPTSAPSELDHEMLGVLAALPYAQRAAVVLRYWADWTDSEIAEALACRPSTVRSHLRRGLGRLRTELEQAR